MMDTQVCSKCGIEKKFSEFYIVRRNKTGYDTRCKVCFKILTDIRNKGYLAGHESYNGTKKKICPVCGVEKTLNKFHKDKTNKNGYSGKRKECVKIYGHGWYQKNHEVIYAKSRKYVLAHPEQDKAYKKKYALNNPEKIIASNRKYAQKNAEKMNEYSRRYRKWKPWMTNAAYKRYMTAKENQYPLYANEDKIKIKYRTAQIMTRITGVQYHVDHIIPLQGKLVSGLHHEDNLQVIKAKDNRAKSGNFIPCFIKINCSFIKYGPHEKIYQLP